MFVTTSRKLIIAFMLLPLLITSCVTVSSKQEVPCEIVVDEVVFDAPFGSTVEQVRRWILTQYALNQESIRVGTYNDSDYDLAYDLVLTETVEWHIGNRIYHADFVDHELVRIQIEWSGDPPDMGDALRCLGQPKDYVAYYFLERVPTLDWQLWYPTKGLMVRSVTEDQRARNQVPPITDDLLVTFITVTQPATTSQEIVPYVFVDSILSIQQLVSTLLQPWTDAEDVVTQIDPVLQDSLQK